MLYAERVQALDIVLSEHGITFFCVFCGKSFPESPTADPDSLAAARRERDQHETSCPESEVPIT